jgi:hypothetical protein
MPNAPLKWFGSADKGSVTAVPELTREILEQYLGSLFGSTVSVTGIAPLGETVQPKSIKTYGYATPLRIDYQVAGEKTPRSSVFHTARPSPFGREHMSDRAQAILWAHQAFQKLPHHARSLDVGAFRSDGALFSLGDVDEFCQLTEYVEGQGYNLDLERMRDTGAMNDLDLERCDALCDYLVGIHTVKGGEPGLYRRRVRELVGHGECIMGLIDTYPPHPWISPAFLEEIEHLCLEWRWKLKPLSHRLRQVHGDFHPWNILFADGPHFHVLDRSRGEWGDPADDVTCLTANYLFFSLQRHGRLKGPLEALFVRFWRRYLDASGDGEMLHVAAPYFAFRGLVMANPLWYPSLPDMVRRRLLEFVMAVLKSEEFDPQKVNVYCGA